MISKARRDVQFLQDIVNSVLRILGYTTGMTWEDYLHDFKTQDAVVRNLEVIGEATKNLSDDIRNQFPDIPWQDMAGTRDRLTHHYFGINQEIVWQIVEHDLPELKDQIEQVLNDFTGGSTK